MSSASRVTGELNTGVEYAGKTHKSFELRPATLGDTIAVDQESEGKGITYRVAALIVRRLEKLGEIPKDEITMDLLQKHMLDDDLFDLIKASGELQKKIRSPKAKPPKN